MPLDKGQIAPSAQSSNVFTENGKPLGPPGSGWQSTYQPQVPGAPVVVVVLQSQVVVVQRSTESYVCRSQ
jgi:hypothetical protein